MAVEFVIDILLELSIQREARSLHDVAGWRREAYFAESGPDWLLVRLDPAGDSGAGTVPGGYIDVEKGDFVVPEGAGLAIVKAGVWTRLDGIDAGGSGPYRWLDPAEEDGRRATPEDVYSPFIHGGILLFSPRPKAEGIAQFADPVLLPDDWAPAAAGALSAALPEEAAMDPPTAELRAGLDRARGHANPLVAAWAWRHALRLAQAEGPEEAGRLAAQEMGRASGPMLALLTRLALDLGDAGAAEAALGAARTATDPARLEAMAAGAYSAALLPTPGAGEAARAALEAMAARAPALDPDGTARPRLRAILQLAGFPR